MIATYQSVVNEWSKDSRGAQLARGVNAKPTFFDVPPIHDTSPQDRIVLRHTIDVSYNHSPFQNIERHDLGQRKQYHDASGDVLTLKFEGEKLLVNYLACNSRMGAPHKRPEINRTIFTLQSGQWARFSYNGRHSSLRSNWRYYRVVVNVAFTSTPADTKIFSGKPDNKFVDEYHL